jgi:hypothetical protein
LHWLTTKLSAAQASSIATGNRSSGEIAELLVVALGQALDTYGVSKAAPAFRIRTRTNPAGVTGFDQVGTACRWLSESGATRSGYSTNLTKPAKYRPRNGMQMVIFWIQLLQFWTRFF